MTCAARSEYYEAKIDGLVQVVEAFSQIGVDVDMCGAGMLPGTSSLHRL